MDKLLLFSALLHLSKRIFTESCSFYQKAGILEHLERDSLKEDNMRHFQKDAQNHCICNELWFWSVMSTLLSEPPKCSKEYDWMCLWKLSSRKNWEAVLFSLNYIALSPLSLLCFPVFLPKRFLSKALKYKALSCVKKTGFVKLLFSVFPKQRGYGC